MSATLREVLRNEIDQARFRLEQLEGAFETLHQLGILDQAQAASHAPALQPARPSRRRGPSAVVEASWECPPGVEAATWDEWLSIRKAAGAPDNARIYEGILLELDKFRAGGMQPQQIIEESAAAGLVGLWRPSGVQNGTPRESKRDDS